MTMNKLQIAAEAAERIISSFSGSVAPDAVETRRTELMTNLPTVEQLAELKKDELLATATAMLEAAKGMVATILELEKPKSKDGLTVEQVARAFMEASELAMFTWPQIALLVKRVLPEANTSSKSIASYASKRKDVWNIVQRERFVFDPAEYMKQATVPAEPAVVNQ